MPQSAKTFLYIILGLVIAVGGFFAFYHFSYADKILTGITAAGLNVSGLTASGAEEKLERDWQQFAAHELQLTDGKKTWSALPAQLGLTLDSPQTIEAALAIGRGNLWYRNLWTEATTLWQNNQIEPIFRVDQKILEEYLQNNFSQLETPPENASLILRGETIAEVPAETGTVIDRTQLTERLTEHLKQRSTATIGLPFSSVQPVITNDTIAPAKLSAVNLLANGLTLRYQNQNWTFNRDKISNALSFIVTNKDGDGIPLAELGPITPRAESDTVKVEIKLSGPDFTTFLDRIEVEVNRPAKNVRLKIAGTAEPKITLNQKKDPASVLPAEVASPAVEGLALNRQRLERDLQGALRQGQSALDIYVEIAEPEVTENNWTELGITKLIGRGTSNFIGSPSNRRHNIGVGAAKFDGGVIPAGATFSFNTTLGAVTREAGYLPELVIKNHDTVPDLGGGLCQVSTTTFRAAVDAGLPVTERRNHAYPVSYYAPQGTDATIYPGSSDLKFINDTPGPILIQTSIEGNILTFDFFGQYDGREVQKTRPRTYGYISGGGLKVEWSYTVTRNGETVTDHTFKSVYRPPSEYHKSGPDEKPQAAEEAKQKEEAAKKAAEEQKKKSTAPPSPSPTPTPSTSSRN